MIKILIEPPSWLGDAVMASSAIENLINYFNNVEITIIGSAAALEVYKNHPSVVKTQILNKKYFQLFLVSNKIGSFDYFISFRSSFRSSILVFFVSSKKKFQFKNSTYTQGHQVEKYNSFVNDCLNQNFLPGKLIIYQNELRIKNKNLPSLGISPGSSYGPAKRWRVEEYSKLVVQLSSNYKILILGSENDKDIALKVEKKLLEQGITNYENLVGKTTIQELITYISGLSIFVAGDSGPMHLAAALDVPTVSIFGPTKSNETSQWNVDKNIILKTNLDCQPCMKRECPLGHNNCMRLIKASEVLKAVNDLS